MEIVTEVKPKVSLNFLVLRSLLLILVVLSSVVLLPISGFAQAESGSAGYSTTNRKAIKLYLEAIGDLRNRQVGRARKELEDALERDSAFLEAHKILADIGFETEGTLKDSYWKDGKYINSIISAVVK
jgi:Tfp pilus assembly protein PilF